MMLTDLDRTLRSAGLDVVEVDGWTKRGHGQMNGVRTITVHHTANGGASGNTPSLNVVKNGRPGLSGPLSQLFLARDGTWYVVAAGLCWHAGESRKAEYGNLWAVGVEAEAVGVPGTKSDWPAVQMASYARGCRALVERYNLSVSDVRGHKETCEPEGRKSDPSFDMATFRQRVASIDLDDDMPLSADDIAKVSKATIQYPLANKNAPGTPDAPNTSVGGALVDIERTQDLHSNLLSELKKERKAENAAIMAAVAKLTEAVQELTNRLSNP